MFHICPLSVYFVPFYGLTPCRRMISSPREKLSASGTRLVIGCFMG